MRGKLLRPRDDYVKIRITPADAGKTITICLCACKRWDHPRGCGENIFPFYQCWHYLGSPPRMRGKRALAVGQIAGGRITPADAGKTTFWVDNANVGKDHPRGCGENCWIERNHVYEDGSPPRMRGKRFCVSASRLLDGITPADAGKTRSKRTQHRGSRDHPRGCGENRFVYRLVVHSSGSPPRMRGKPQCHRVRKPPAGITPADAGKT